MAMKPIEILINAKDEASGVFDRLSGKLKLVGAAIAGYFGIKAFAGIVQGAADLEQGMSRVQAATGATAEEMAKLRKAAEDAGADTKFTSTEAAAALENLAKAGLSAGDSIEALPAVLNLAQAGDVGLAESAEFVTKSVMGMGEAFSQAGRFADVLALGANATNTSVTGLSQALSYAAPVAQSAGVKLEGTVAILGKMADAGIDASRSGTALANMLAQFQDPASAFKRALADAGITTNNFEQALHELAAAGPKGEKAILAVGLNAGPALRALLNQGMPALDELKAKLEGAAGSAAAAAKVMEDNLAGSMNGLTSAWDTVKNALGTPVLPVLKDGVDQLAGAFRSAVADGTIGKFGEAIASAFQAGIKWVKEFAGQMDFAELTERMRGFADRAGEVFTQVGEYATNAGNIVKLAYGVMSGGANTVMAAIYGIAASYTEAAIRIVDFSARASDALAKISIGQARKDLQQQAEDMRGVLVGLSGVRDAFIEKTLDSLDATAQSAQAARDGFSGLTGSLQASATASTAAAAAQNAENKALEEGAVAAAAAGVAYQKKAQAEQAAVQVAGEHAAKIKELEAEYAALMASGNINQAVIVYDELAKAQRGIFKSSDELVGKQKEASQATQEHAAQIRVLEAEYAALRADGNMNDAIIVFDKLVKAQRQLATSSKEAAKAAVEAAAQIDAAFGRLGVTSSAALKEQATNAQRDYDIIKNAGTSTAEDIGAAFKVAAEKAIAANNGIAPSWVEAQAAARGYQIEVDATGKATVKSMDDAKAAVGGVAKAHTGATGAVGSHAASVRDLAAAYSDAGARALAAQGQFLAAAHAQKNADTGNSSITKTQGNMGPVDAVPTFNNKEEAEAWRKQWQAQYERDNPFSTNRKGQLGSYMYDLTMFEFKKELDALSLRDAMKAANGGTTPTSSTQMPTAGTNTTTVNITVEGTTRSINTDAQGAATLQELIRQLTQGKSTALR